jgi:hypothetical protein
METFQKRQKENAAVGTSTGQGRQRQEIKARKAAGITSESDRDTEATENAAAPGPAVDPSTIE